MSRAICLALLAIAAAATRNGEICTSKRHTMYYQLLLRCYMKLEKSCAAYPEMLNVDTDLHLQGTVRSRMNFPESCEEALARLAFDRTCSVGFCQQCSKAYIAERQCFFEYFYAARGFNCAIDCDSDELFSHSAVPGKPRKPGFQVVIVAIIVMLALQVGFCEIMNQHPLHPERWCAVTMLFLR